MNMTPERYQIQIQYSVPDAGYIGIVPAFDGIAVFGDTRQEALAEAESAIQTVMQICREDDIEMPAEDTWKGEA